MKQFTTLTILLLLVFSATAGKVEKTYTFSGVRVAQEGRYQTISLDNTLLAGRNGEPLLPYHQVALMLPPGEKAVRINITRDERIEVPGVYELYPRQYDQPLSKGPSGDFIKNERVYNSRESYPSVCTGNLLNSVLNGYSFAMTTFTPAEYVPVTGKFYYYRKVTVSVITRPDSETRESLKNLTASAEALKRVRLFAQNPEMMRQYPEKSPLKTSYEILIITPSQFQTAFQELANFYNSRNRPTQVETTESIAAQITGGQDLQEKIRMYITLHYQAAGIEQVILGGDVEHVPYRGMYCYVISGSGYEDNNIPADIYYSALDGTWNSNGNAQWGEPAEADLLPEISVGRMSFSSAAELSNMIHKSVSYQGSPVAEEMKKPYLVSEFLYDPPVTYGSDYLELLVDDHNDNGYFTHGIPSATNLITRLYDDASSNWSTGQVLAGINAGKSFIHHCGHSNSNYMMRLYNWDITDQNFYAVDGVTHNYQLMYTHGCICGAFDDEDCIAERSTNIAKFLAGGVFNSRYGWFNQGTTEGPSAHLHREFISALYHPVADSAMLYLGSAHTMSKIKTAPWVGLPGEFEPGAQRWCHYDCNVLGDPALRIWTDNPPVVGVADKASSPSIAVSPNPCRDFALLRVTGISGRVTVQVTTLDGKTALETPGLLPAGGGEIRLSTRTLAAGIYLLRVGSETGTTAGKLVVSR